MPLGIYGNACWATKLAIVTSLLSEFGQKLSFTVELLHSEISSIRHKNVVILIDGDMSWAVEFALAISVHAEMHNRLAFGVEDVDSVIVTFGDYNPTI